MIRETFIISKPTVPLKSFKRESSELETEGIFGESCIVLKKKDDWIFCKLLKDGYEGWLKKTCLGMFIEPNFKVKTLKTIMFNKPDIKSKPYCYLTFGSQVFVNYFSNDWAEVNFYDLKKKFKKFIPKNHLIEIKTKDKDWVKIAEKFIGTPYLWGGKSSFGIDCSGLVQTVINFQNISFPRNSIQQLQKGTNIISEKLSSNSFENFHKIYKSKVKRGDLIFWKGHVAIALNHKEIIHANAFHMLTIKENFEITNKRLMHENYKWVKVKRIINM